MVKISELNKKERDLKNTLENLKKEYRKNQISKNDYDSAVKDKKNDLERVDEEKKKLIGKLPPIPPAPKKSSPLSEIKKEITAEKPVIEKPAAKATKTITVKPVSEEPKPAIKEPMPSVDDSQDRISRALKRMGDETDTETIKKVFEETQKEFLTFLLEVKKNRERVQQLEALFSEVNDIRKRFNAMDFKGMTDEIYRQFERMNSLIKENGTKIEELVSNNETKIGALEKRMDEVASSTTNIPAVDDMKRDVETIKQKIEWVERNAKETDMQPVMDMMNDVERKLDGLKVRSPYIIE